MNFNQLSRLAAGFIEEAVTKKLIVVLTGGTGCARQKTLIFRELNMK